MKGGRRKAREDALKILYQLDLNHDLSPEAGLVHFQAFFSQGEVEMDPFTKKLVLGVAEKVKELDGHISRVSEHWRADRMAAIDRNLLRIGVYELHFCDDIPSTVSINEMIELAKEFGSESTPAFVNGILDKIKTSIQNPAKAP